MRAFPTTLVLVVALLVSTLTADQDRPGSVTPLRDRPPAATSGTASLKGRVVAADGTPLRRAQVSLGAPEAQFRRTVATDAEGRWQATALPAGRYLIGASKAGYVSVQYGQRRPLEAGTPVVVAEGQVMQNVDIALPRGGVITGRVLDDGGDPVAGARVQAQRYQYTPDGQRRLAISSAATTDDLGQFRIFGLNPGDYAISAAMMSNLAVTDSSPEPTSVPESLGATYYPGTTNPAEAQVIPISIGQEASVQIQLVATRVGRITGTVVSSEGRPLSGVQVMVRGGSDIGALNLNGITGTAPDGSFSIANVQPGEYMLSVQSVRSDAGAEFANVPVTVSTDTVNVRVVTGQGTLVSGRVTWDGQSSRTMPPATGIAAIAALSTPRVALQPASPGVTFGVPNAPGRDGTIQDDGTFAVAGTGGKVFVRVAPAPPPWIVRSVTLDGEDITDVPVDLTGRTGIDNVRIVMTDKSGDVAGRVVDTRGNAVKDYVVVLLPSGLPPGASPQRFIRLARPEQSGQFRVRGLPPGRYTATALEWIEPGRQFVPEFQEELRRQGKAVTLREGESATIDLSLSGL